MGIACVKVEREGTTKAMRLKFEFPATIIEENGARRDCIATFSVTDFRLDQSISINVETFDQAVLKVKEKFAPDVVRIDWMLKGDHDGVPALFVDIVLTEEVGSRPKPNDYSAAFNISRAVEDELRPQAHRFMPDRFMYTSVKLEGEGKG